MTTVLLATAEGVWDDDVDAGPLTTALAAAGLDARPAVWDDPGVPWAEADLVLVRSTWDYVGRLAEFLDWAARVEGVTRLANPAAVLQASTDKTYLADLDADGVPVVPTGFLRPGDLDGGVGTRALVDRIAEHAGTGELVVKPTVSAGSKDTARYPAEDLDTAARHAADLLAAGRAVVVQPYLAAVDHRGETGVVVLDGEPSHAFGKGPLLTVGAGMVEGLYAPETIEPRTATPEELAVAAAAVDATARRFGRPPAYARVDLLHDDAGHPCVLELELCEPSLFLWTDPTAADRVAAAVARWATA